MDLDTVAQQTLQSCYSASRFRRAAHSWARTELSYRTRRCFGCGQGLHLRLLPPDRTLLVCPGCSWTATIPFIMDEGRWPGEPYRPGQTASRRPTVTLGPTGEIRRVQL